MDGTVTRKEWWGLWASEGGGVAEASSGLREESSVTPRFQV